MSEAKSASPHLTGCATEPHCDPVPPPPLHSLSVQPARKSGAVALPDNRKTREQETRSSVVGKKLQICTSVAAEEDVHPRSPLPTLSTGVPRGAAFVPESWSPGSIEYKEKADVDDGFESNANQYYGLDVERQSCHGYKMPSDGEYLTLSNPSATAASSIRDVQIEDESKAEEHMRGIIMHLSLFSPLLTILICLYAFLALPVLLVLSLLHVSPLRILLTRAVLPAFHLQLALIHSSCPTTTQPTTSTLILVLFGSPIYATAIAVASWVAAGFWCYAAILGEPNQDGKRDDDGRKAAGAVRRWWERWLLKGVGERG